MFEIKVIKEPIKLEEVMEIAKNGYGDMVKAVVDVEQEILAIGSELHVDAESNLIEEKDSKREYCWGINIYPTKTGEEFIEFDSMVNIKPGFGNRSRGVENKEIQEKIREIVSKLIK